MTLSKTADRILKQSAGMAELADAPDLKSGGIKPMPVQARLPAHNDAGWSSLVARRAHNPKVDGSNPSPANAKN